MRAVAWLALAAALAAAALGRARRGCPPPPPLSASPGELARAARVVFTGKVSAELGGGRYVVRVKRLLKGLLDGEEGSSSSSPALVRLLAAGEGREVEVMLPSPAGAGPRCAGLRLHQTAVFLARGTGLLQLVSPPLPLTLTNLDKVNAAVKDIVYKPRPPIIEEPCEKTYCQYGADCVTRADGSALCECPADCPVAATPVCGSDGLTYSNHCLLRLHACRSAKNIRVQYGGECGTRPRQKGHTAVNY